MFRQMIRRSLLQTTGNFSTARFAGLRQTRHYGLVLVGSVAVGFTAAYTMSKTPILLDVQTKASPIITPVNVEYNQPETKVNPFPFNYKYNNVEYSLLGTGVRSVSFLGIQVYAVGVYIATDDQPKVKQILRGATEQELRDPESGSALISKLLNGGVRFDIRIVPVRNTDFGHLRDGLVRTIMAHPRFKEEGNNEEFGDGLSQLKLAFGRKMAMAKNKVLHLNRDASGILEAQFFKADKEDDVEAIEMGKVTNPLVSEFLFLQYLSGKKPSSESARQNAVKRLAELA